MNYAGAMAQYDLAWFEEPVDPDYDSCRDGQVCAMPIATAENLYSRIDALNLIRHGGLRRIGIGCSSTRRSATARASTSPS